VSCNRYWKEGIFLVEADRPDPHRDTCPACQEAHRLRNEIVVALSQLGANIMGDRDWSARVWERIALQDRRRGRRGAR
jgi:hypothetical protein